MSYLIIFMFAMSCGKNKLTDENGKLRRKNKKDVETGKANLQLNQKKKIQNDSNKIEVNHHKKDETKNNTLNYLNIKRNDKEDKNDLENLVSGLNIHGKCNNCNYQKWMKLGYGDFDMSIVEHANVCDNCHKESDILVLKILGVGPLKYNYCFALKDEKIVKRDKGILKNGEQLSLDFLYKYRAFSYGRILFEHI